MSMNQNKILRKYSHLALAALLTVSTFGFLSEARAAKSVQNLIELTGIESKQMSEKDLYVQVVERYRASDMTGLRARVRLFVQKYPKSIYADNALYLSGRLAFEQKKYADAIGQFNQLIQKYPNSNKVVSAQYAKALTFQRMNLSEQSRSVLTEVAKKFPGSVEAARARSELKVMAQGAQPSTVKK